MHHHLELTAFVHCSFSNLVEMVERETVHNKYEDVKKYYHL